MPTPTPMETEPAPTPDIELLIVRAGRTCWDDCKRVKGRTDLPLSERGRAEVHAAIDAAQPLVTRRLAVVYTGPDEASEQTAEILADQFGGKRKTLDELIGWNLGLWHGLTEDELAARSSRAWERWTEDPTSVTPPAGEHADEVAQRLRDAMLRIAAKAQAKPVAAVLRPLQIAILACWLDEQPLRHLWDRAHEAPAVQRLRIDPHTLRGQVLATIAGATASV